MGAVLDAFVPDGPLHPGDAMWGVGVGVVVALFARRRSPRWVVLVVAALVLVVGFRHGDLLVAGYRDRPAPWYPLGGTLAAVAIACHPRFRAGPLIPAVGAACAGVWAIVPDTEVPLLAGAVLLGSSLGRPRDPDRRWLGLLVVLPFAAAVAGSVGRPDRLGLALGAAAVAFAGVVAAGAAGRPRWGCGQRAGMPTTVAPAGTSRVTTAPAPTTAP